MSTNFSFSKVCWQCFVFTPQANFPAHKLNFHRRWWDQILAIFLNFFYFTQNKVQRCHKSLIEYIKKMLLDGGYLLHVIHIANLCLVHLLSQNLVRAYSNFLSMLNFLCILKIILVYSKVRFYYINCLIWVHLKCFEYTLKIWVYLKI